MSGSDDSAQDGGVAAGPFTGENLSIKWMKLGGALISGMLAAFFRGAIAIPLGIRNAFADLVGGLTGVLTAFIDAIFGGTQEPIELPVPVPIPGTDSGKTTRIEPVGGLQKAIATALDSTQASIASLPGPLQFALALLIIGAAYYALQWGVSRFG